MTPSRKQDVNKPADGNRPTTSEINTMKKDDLARFLRNAYADIDKLNDKIKDVKSTTDQKEDNSTDDLVDKIDRRLQNRLDGFKQDLQKELHDSLNGKLTEIKVDYTTKMEQLQTENTELRKVVSVHQHFLESLDHENRACSMIITGVPEAEDLTINNQTATTDEQKCDLILEKLDQYVTKRSIDRLGKREADRNRPIKLVLATREQRDEVVKSSRKLKDITNPNNVTNNIFIKKDQHPLIRKEWQRLYDVLKQERARPDNEGKDIQIDRQTRTIKVNGIVIDKFQSF